MARPSTSSKREDLKKLHSDAELIDELAMPGLIVVDMYPHFAGPCEPMQSIFKRLAIDYGDAVRFVQAQTDHIDAFTGWRNKSCPTFSFWVIGVLVKVIKGANAPLIERTIKEQVDINKVTTERIPIQPDIDIPPMLRKSAPVASATNDPLETGTEDTKETILAESNLPQNTAYQLAVNDDFIVSLIKPDAMLPHIIEDIHRILRSQRFEIAREKRLWLTKDQAIEFYIDQKDESTFDELIKYMTSGPCIALLLAHENAVKLYNDIIGPIHSKRAAETAPDSIRALYGKDDIHNVVHASESQESAKREIDFLFNEPVMSTSHTNLTTTTSKSYILTLPTLPINTDITATVTIITPDAEQHTDEIIQRILLLGFEITKRETMALPKDRAVEFWRSAKESKTTSSKEGIDNQENDNVNKSDIYEQLAVHWSSGPLTVLIVKREDAITALAELAGPEDINTAKETLPGSLRALFGTDNIKSAVYTSLSTDISHKDQAFFFPRPSTGRTTIQKNIERTLALIKPDAVAANHTVDIMDKIKEAGFTIVMNKPLQMTLELAQDFYKDHVGKPFYDTLTAWMSSVPIHALVLEKQDGIQAWRDLMGPTNSEKARTTAPESLRALYGKDGSENACHGSDSKDNAQREIRLIFKEEQQQQEEEQAQGSEQQDEQPQQQKQEEQSQQLEEAQVQEEKQQLLEPEPTSLDEPQSAAQEEPPVDTQPVPASTEIIPEKKPVPPSKSRPQSSASRPSESSKRRPVSAMLGASVTKLNAKSASTAVLQPADTVKSSTAKLTTDAVKKSSGKIADSFDEPTPGGAGV